MVHHAHSETLISGFKKNLRKYTMTNLWSLTCVGLEVEKANQAGHHTQQDQIQDGTSTCEVGETFYRGKSRMEWTAHLTAAKNHSSSIHIVADLTSSGEGEEGWSRWGLQTLLLHLASAQQPRQYWQRLSSKLPWHKKQWWSQWFCTDNLVKALHILLLRVVFICTLRFRWTIKMQMTCQYWTQQVLPWNNILLFPKHLYFWTHTEAVQQWKDNLQSVTNTKKQ